MQNLLILLKAESLDLVLPLLFTLKHCAFLSWRGAAGA